LTAKVHSFFNIEIKKSQNKQFYVVKGLCHINIENVSIIM